MPGLVEPAPVVAELGVSALEDRLGLVIAAARDQQARVDRATLPGVEHQHGRRHVHREIVRILEHDLGRLAAEFEEHALHRRRALCHDVLADAGRAGEADQVDARVGDQHLARQRRVVAEHNVEHARRKTRLGREFAEDRAHSGGVRRRLEDHRATGEQRGDDFADVDVERDVPRGDRADHPDRLVNRDALVHHPVAGALAIAFLPFDLGEDRQVILPSVQRHVDMRAPDRAERRAPRVAGQVGQAMPVGIEQVVELADQPHPKFDVGRPVAVVERTPRGGDRLVDVGGGAIGGAANRLSGPRADDGVRSATFGVAQFAVDEQASVGKHGHQVSLCEGWRARSLTVAKCRSGGESITARKAAVAAL